MPFGDLELPELSLIYARFAALTAMSADLGGWLLLYSGLDRDGVAVTMASNVAGTASLGMELDASRAKQALRSGVCDFVVNNLNEALRILKNEVRNRRAVSVVLIGEVEATVAEMVARGVQPDILTFPVPAFVDRGARRLVSNGQDGLVPVRWEIASEPLRWLPLLDEMAIASLRTEDVRARWVRAAPRYLGRGFAEKRYVRMTPAEVDTFTAAIRKAVTTEQIPVEVFVTHGE
jgi:Urocanase Rossmann-like domain